jgi:hypothetical protein
MAARDPLGDFEPDPESGHGGCCRPTAAPRRPLGPRGVAPRSRHPLFSLRSAIAVCAEKCARIWRAHRSSNAL